MASPLLVVVSLVVATSDGGSQCELLAASPDGHYAVYSSYDLNEGDSTNATLVDLRAGKDGADFATVQPVHAATFQAIPAEVVSKYGLRAPPLPRQCSLDGRYCVRLLPLDAKRSTPAPGSDEAAYEAETGFPPAPTFRGTFAVELIGARRRVELFHGSTSNYGIGLPVLGEALRTYWLGDRVAIIGYVMSESRPQWGSLSAVCAFKELPPGPRLDRATMARTFYETGLEFRRKKLGRNGQDYFTYAAYLDARYAPTTCAVAHVKADDVLTIRAEPEPRSTQVGEIPPTAKSVGKLGPALAVGRQEWVEVEYESNVGWVNAAFLDCAPPRILPTPAAWATSPAWTSPHLVVWGGTSDGDVRPTSAAAYDPKTNRWQPLSRQEVPLESPGGELSLPVWTGTALISWPGEIEGKGNIFEPRLWRWQQMSQPAFLDFLYGVALAWTGEKLVAWNGFRAMGGVYDPRTDRWRPMQPLTDAPDMRYRGVVAWTGRELIVWSGQLGSMRAPPLLANPFVPCATSGARYDPALDAWRALPKEDAPPPGIQQVAVWTGRELIVWGGTAGTLKGTVYSVSGARYDPVADRWRPMTTKNAPIGRAAARAVWTGEEMLVWGGYVEGGSRTNTGGAYNPASDTWRALPLEGAPQARREHGMVWSGDRQEVQRHLALALASWESTRQLRDIAPLLPPPEL